MITRWIPAISVLTLAFNTGCGDAIEAESSSKTKTPAVRQEKPELDPVATSLGRRPVYTFALKSVAFSPDGKLLATGNGQGMVQIWNVASGKVLRRIKAHSNWAFSVAFSPDSKLLASGGGDNLIKLWDVTTGKKRRELAGHTDDVHGVVFLDGGKRLASGADDKTVRIWDLKTGKSNVLKGHERQVTAVAISPDGNTVASASRDMTIKLWDAQSGKLLRTLCGHNGDVLDLEFTRLGSQIASASYDQTARMWDVATGKHLRKYSATSNWVFAVAVSPNGKQLATGAGDRKLRLWKTDGKSPEHTLTLRADISALDYAPDGITLAAALIDGTVQLITLKDNKPGKSRYLGQPQPVPLQLPHSNTATSSVLQPQEYLTLHLQVTDPGNDGWKKAVARLADVGDGFSLQLLQKVESDKLSPEDVTLFESALKSIKQRADAEDAAQVAADIRHRLERAATADLQCHALEGRLKRWTMASIKPHIANTEVRQELERIRDHYKSKVKLQFGGLTNRVRQYAATLLKSETRDNDD